MFHFPAFPPHTLYIQVQVTGHDSSQVSPFGHPRITARLPTPQGLSQATTSFIGSRCQGIHHVPFIACHTTNTPHPPTTPTPQAKAQRKKQGNSSRHKQNSNCYKDARVHYKKTKHQAQQPTNPRTTRTSRKQAPETHTNTPAQHAGQRMRPQNPNSVPPDPDDANGVPTRG